MKRKLAVVLLTATMIASLAGCGAKTQCDFCGEEKVCTEATFWGETVNICEDCKAELGY